MIKEFFTSSQNAPFIWALLVMTCLSLVVVIASLIGAIEVHGADADLDVDWGEGDFGSHVLEYLGVAAMPVSVFVMVASCSFFVTGYVMQMFAHSMTGNFLQGWVAILPAFIVSVVACRSVGKVFAKSKFKLHTTAVLSSSFLYKLVTIHQGTARTGLAAEAKLLDEHGQTHYILVEPANKEEIFEQGSEVILVEQRGPTFLAVSGKLEDILKEEREKDN
jgi:hypothetical protein